jgi:5-deoxy-glucuronate isomerase
VEGGVIEGCGRVRKPLDKGWTSFVETELTNLRVGTILLGPGESHTVETGDREFAFVLVRGRCGVQLSSGPQALLGPRANPFEHPPFGFFASKGETATFLAEEETLIGAGSSPAAAHHAPALVTPREVGGGVRGLGNWQREVRFVCWTDNTKGSSLIAGETVTPSGNWSTIPPHRHQYDNPSEEVPYEEVYFFQFSKPQGYGLAWQFNDDGTMDQAFSLRTNDALYMSSGYHPTACGPGATLYHLTFIAGPYRMSKSRVHDDFRFLLDENNLENPYAKQHVGAGG